MKTEENCVVSTDTRASGGYTDRDTADGATKRYTLAYTTEMLKNILKVRKISKHRAEYMHIHKHTCMDAHMDGWRDAYMNTSIHPSIHANIN